MRWLLPLLVVCAWLPAAEPPAKAVEWARGRDQLRKGRLALEQGVEQDRAGRAVKAARAISELIAKGATLGASRTDADLLDLIAGVRFLHPPSAEPLTAALAMLPEQADPAQAKAWAQLLDARRDDVLRPTERLFKQALDGGVPAVARDCIDQALVFWPDHRALRRNLGDSKVDGRWYGPQDAESTKAGLRWDDELGWIIGAEKARYAAGEYFDLQAKQWTTLEQADAAHAKLANRWVVQTEHLQIQGTAPLKALVDTANRLEAFYDRVFAAYAGFFLTPGKRSDKDIRLLFGTLDHPRLVVNVAKDENAYRGSLPPATQAGWSAGMFIPMTRQSYFYAGPVEVIYHEFTHQILHLFTGTDRAPAWLVEGAAVYTEAPQFIAERMQLGHIAGNSHLRAFIRQERTGKALSLERILAIEDGFAWSRSSTPELNYPAAGAVVQFCMEAEERRYRSDFIDFLRDSYRGETRGYKLWEYLGMDYGTFDRRFADWRADFVRQLEAPAAATYDPAN